MPSNDVHSFWARRSTGLACSKTHRIIDSFSTVKGNKHREYFHDPVSASAVARISEGSMCVPAALNHLYIDKLYAEPNTKVVMEMTRLAEKQPAEPTPHTPIIPKRNGCIVKRNAFNGT